MAQFEGLTLSAVGKYAPRFAKQPAAHLWEDVEALAASVWTQYTDLLDADDPWPPDLASTWHHLLLGVANFKRERWVDPQLRVEKDRVVDAHTSDGLRIVFPDGTRHQVRRDDQSPAPDHGLSAFHGFGSAPTGSALLAALWPKSHLIVDRRAYAVALVASSDGWEKLKKDHPGNYESGTWVVPSWADYEWFAELARETAAKTPGLTLQSIERTFFELDREIPAYERGDHDWEVYRKAVSSRLGGQ